MQTIEQTPAVETRVVGIIDVDSTNSTYYFGYDVTTLENSFSSMEIDGVTQSSIINEYVFSSVGEHTIKLTLKDPTKLKSQALRSGDYSRLIIPDNVIDLGDNSSGYCSYLYDVTIGSNVRLIGEYAFYENFSLTSINIPDSVQIIENNAFGGCSSLNNVTIGTGVTQIGNEVFYTIKRNATFVIKATTPPTFGTQAFRRSGAGTLYVPSESLSAYQTALSAYVQSTRPSLTILPIQ